MSYGKNIITIRNCPFKHTWVNQGYASCDKGKDPFNDCKECEYMEEHEAEVTWASIDND